MKKVTVRQMINALQALPEDVKDLPFQVCPGSSAECDPTNDLKVYIQPTIIRQVDNNPTGRTFIDGPPKYVTLDWDF